MTQAAQDHYCDSLVTYVPVSELIIYYFSNITSDFNRLKVLSSLNVQWYSPKWLMYNMCIMFKQLQQISLSPWCILKWMVGTLTLWWLRMISGHEGLIYTLLGMGPPHSPPLNTASDIVCNKKKEKGKLESLLKDKPKSKMPGKRTRTADVYNLDAQFGPITLSS